MSVTILKLTETSQLCQDGIGTYGTCDKPNDSCNVIVVNCFHGNQYSVCRDVENGWEYFKGEALDDSDHCHPPVVVADNNVAARRKLIIACVLCVFFMIGEIIGGVISNSLAIATDAAHLLTDIASFLVSLFSLWVSSKPATKRMSFGWHRAEVIGALVSVLMIWVITGVLVYLAAERIKSKQFEINATVMLITSGLGLLVNILMGCVLHDHGHSHGPKTDHAHLGDEADQSKPGQNINVRAAYIHVLGDFIQSAGVFVAALIIYFNPDLIIVDPICTFLFSVLVLITTCAIIKDTITVLMEGLPKGIDFNDVYQTLMSIPGVVKVHNLRIWALSMEKIVLSAHIVVDKNVSSKGILREATKKITMKFKIMEITLQVEEYHANMDECHKCQTPDS